MEQELHPNAGKNDIIEVDGVRYQRLPIKNHLITEIGRASCRERVSSPV